MTTPPDKPGSRPHARPPSVAALARALREADAEAAIEAFLALQEAGWPADAVAAACARSKYPLLETAVVHAVDAARHFISPKDMGRWAALVALAIDAGARPRLKNPRGHAGFRLAMALTRSPDPLHPRATAVLDDIAVRLVDAGLSMSAPRARVRRGERLWGERVATALLPLPRFRARWHASMLHASLPVSDSAATSRRL